MNAHESGPSKKKKKYDDFSISNEDLQDAGPFNNKEKPFNTSSGIHCGLPGNEYQILVTMFALLRVYNKYQKQMFELRMERTDAGKFDDIWIKVENEELFIQVKYESAKSNITRGMLLPGTKRGRDKDPFSLYKYCESFSQLNNSCVLLTNKNISNDISEVFDPFKRRNLFTKLFGTLGQHYRVRNDSRVIGELSNFRSIESFCKQFILSVNYPNADDLVTKIKEEIEDLVDANFKILKEDAEHVFNRLREKLVNFVCKKESRGTTIDKTWILLFIQKINKDYKCIINTYYHEFSDRMQNYSNVIIKEERMDSLNDQLSVNQVVLLTFTKTTFLRLVQSYQLVKDDRLFTYLLFSRLNNPTTKFKFETALKSSESKRSNLLILVDDEGDERSVFDWIKSIPKESTKIIVVSSKAPELKAKCDEQNISAAIDTEEITLADLSDESRNKFLKQKIMFQGFETELGNMPELGSLQRNIYETLLQNIVKGVRIEIGSKLTDVSSCCPFYIPRTFTVNLSFFRDVEELNSIEMFPYNNDCPRIEYNNEVEVSDENKLIDIKKINNWPNDNNQWLFSNFGCKQYLSSITYSCSEEHIFQHSPNGYIEKLKILSGEIGTGKSTTWLQLANLLKKSDTSVWVVYMNLSDGAIQNQLSAKLNSAVTEEFISTLLEQAVSNNSWEWEYFRTCLNTASNKVSVFLDGFDEICPSYKTKVIEIIKCLIEMPVQSIFVSSRMYMEMELEKEFLTTAYHLQSLNENEQISLIKNIWSERGDTEEDIDHIVRRMIQKLESFMSVYDFNFATTNIGAPLAIKMISNLPREKVEDFLKNDYTIYDLFEDFVLQIFDRYCTEKVGMLPERNTVQNAKASFRRDFYEKLSLFAMKWLFTSNDLEYFLTEEERNMLREISKKSIEETTVCELILYPPRFIHRSYAEYFVASFMYYKFERTNDVEQFWNTYGRVLNLDAKDLVGIFFVYKLEKECCKNVESYKVKKVIKLLNLISPDPAQFVCRKKFPNCFRTYLLNSPSERSKLIDFAIQYNLLEMIKILLELGGDQYDLLNKAILQNRQDLVQYLVGESEHLNRRDGLTLLHKAARVGNINIAHELISKGADLNVQDSFGYTPTLLAYKHRQFYMASFLREKGGSFDGSPSLRDVGENLDCFAPFDGLRTDIRDTLLLLFTQFTIDQQCTTFKILEQRDDHTLLKIDDQFVLLTKNLDLFRCIEVFVSNQESLESECYIITDEYFTPGTQIADSKLELFFLASFCYSNFIQIPTFNTIENYWQIHIAQQLTQSSSINDSNAIKFASNLKFINAARKRSIFLEQILLRLKQIYPFRCPEYTLARLEYTLVTELKEGMEWNRERVKSYLLDLYQEAYELYSAEARLKYCNFRFKEPVTSIPALEHFLQSPNLKPYIVGNVIEAGKIVQFLKPHIDHHIPGWMIQSEEARNILSHGSKLVFVHNLDCQSDLNYLIEDCEKLILKNSRLKIILSHQSQLSVNNMEDVLADDFISEILHHPITFQANKMTLGMLTDSLFQYCIESGALEYMALNLPICFGQQHPLYYNSWEYKIVRTVSSLDLPIYVDHQYPLCYYSSDYKIKKIDSKIVVSPATFHESLAKILREKIAFISSDHELFIMACRECALSEEFPTPAALSFLACEASWCFKDKWVIALDEFPQIDEKCPTIDTLLTWTQFRQHDMLSRSCLELCLRKSPNDVILILDARDTDLDQNFTKFLEKLSDVGFFSVLVHIKNDQLAQSATLNVKLYSLQKADFSPSFEWKPPNDARICDHVKRNWRDGTGRAA